MGCHLWGLTESDKPQGVTFISGAMHREMLIISAGDCDQQGPLTGWLEKVKKISGVSRVCG